VANIYPVVRTSWLDLLAHLFVHNLDRDLENRANIAFRLFRQFLVLKIAVAFVFHENIYEYLSFSKILVLLVVILAGTSRFYMPALLVVFCLCLYDIFYSWPFSINHQILEFVIIILMCLMPAHNYENSSFSCSSMIKILMLSVWFFSGLHKLFDGYYWNAEFFALEALSGTTTLGYCLNKILASYALLATTCCTQGVVHLTRLQVGLLLSLSWLTIAVEIFLPLSLLFPKLRALGIGGLFIFQGLVAYFSGEIDFAFSAFAILLLFIPRAARWSYPCLALLFLMVKPWI
jgi:hypothetical protein